jgi:hypothetical protein
MTPVDSIPTTNNQTKVIEIQKRANEQTCAEKIGR